MKKLKVVFTAEEIEAWLGCEIEYAEYILDRASEAIIRVCKEEGWAILDAVETADVMERAQRYIDSQK